MATSRYVLGSKPDEVARLDAQATLYADATELLLRRGGIGPGMRVLDLGTGPGHVAQLVAELVGPHGEVVGIDGDEALLRVAEERRAEAGLEDVRFIQADVREFVDERPFDAVVGRLILFHLPDAVDVLRRCATLLRPDGLVVAIDFDAGAGRTDPPVPLVEAAFDYVRSSFRRARANPTIGTRLALLLREAGLADVASVGVQSYFAPGDPRGPALLGGVVRTLAARSPDEVPAELALDGLEERIAAALTAEDAVLLPPTLVGAWGHRERAP